MQERENVLRIFKETKESISKNDVAKIRDLSNQTTNTASLTQDPDNIGAAVVVYALSKILERQDYKQLPGWNPFYKIYLKAIDNIILAIEKNDDSSYDANIKAIHGAIEKLSGKLGKYIKDVFRQASINKASRLYDHGISMEKTARLLGITLYELAEYIGERQEDELPETRTLTATQRIKLAMEIFS